MATPNAYLTQLRSEFLTDPAGMGYLGFLSGYWPDLTNLVNTPLSGQAKQVRQVPIQSVLLWACDGPFQKLHDYTMSGTDPVNRSICFGLTTMFATADVFDLALPGNVARVNRLANSGVISPGDRAALLGLTQVSPASRAEVLFGDGFAVQVSDVQAALGG